MQATPGGDDSPAPPGVRNELSHVAGSVVQAGHIDVVNLQAKPPMPVPRQVPLLSSRFVNRVAEFARAKEVLETGSSVRIMLISGMPGVGKSSFTWRLAEQVRDQFAGGQLYVDFSAAEQQRPDAVGDVLTRFLAALGVAKDVMPSGVPEKITLYRSMTADKPTLVVLDKVTEPAQVLPFKPNAPGSAILVTSTDRMTDLLLDGAEPMPMEPLDDDAGAQLLAELGGQRAEPAEMAELVRQCGGLPVALQVAAARLRSRPTLRVAGLLTEIADEHRGLDAFTLRGESRVVAVFAVAYAGLPDQPARLYRLLGLLPSHLVTVDLAAALAGIEPAAAEDALAHLHEVSLLAAEDDRFRLHALIRRHARDRAFAVETPADRSAALHRAIRHVLTWAAFGDLAALGPKRLRCIPHAEVLGDQPSPFAHDEPRTAEQRGLDWMDAMRPTSLGLLRVAIDHGWFDEAWQLAESMTALFAVRRYLVDWTEFSELGARAAHAVGNAAAEARLRSFASRPWAELGDLPSARRELDAAFALAQSLTEPTLLASIWEMEGRYRDDVGDHRDAVAAYERAVALFEQAAAPRGVAFVTSYIGASLLAQGDPRQAAEVLARARDLIHAVHNDRVEGEAMIALGSAQRQLGRHDDARATLVDAIAVLAGDYRYQEACAYETLADVEEDSDAAIASLRTAITIHQELHSPRSALLRDRLDTLTRGGESSPGAPPGQPTP